MSADIGLTAEGAAKVAAFLTHRTDVGMTIKVDTDEAGHPLLVIRPAGQRGPTMYVTADGEQPAAGGRGL